VDLPDDFQKSEFLLKHGAIDMIVHRRNIRTKVHGLLKKIHKAK
jgi:acetyl-CoA carboxylase carboxyl transferase subunit beta